MEQDTQIGVTKKDIPYEGQIIRVADEYDAIVSKRQYKSHIGISDTLKIIIENTKPSKNAKSSTLSEISENTRLGKNNPLIVRKLFKVVIDDIEYEISRTITYLDELKEHLKRFAQIEKYYNKMQSSLDDKKRNYYLEGIKLLLKNDESVDRVMDIYEDYKEAYEKRKDMIDNLYNEVKIIKKLKV